VPTWHRPSLAWDTSFTATAWQPVGDHLRCPTVLACATAPPLVAGDRLTTAVERALPSLVLVLGRGLVAGGSRVKGGQQNLRVADPHRVEVRAPGCCQQSASNRTTRSLAWLMHAREVSAVYLWRHAVGADHAWEQVVAAKSSHGRSHRFDPCHAHQPKRLPGPLERAACQKICQKIADLGCLLSRSAWLGPSCRRVNGQLRLVVSRLVQLASLEHPVSPSSSDGVIASATWRVRVNRWSSAWTTRAAICGVVCR
jgi:hypothetical protein